MNIIRSQSSPVLMYHTQAENAEDSNGYDPTFSSDSYLIANTTEDANTSKSQEEP